MNQNNNLKKINSMFAAAAVFAFLVTGCSTASSTEASSNVPVSADKTAEIAETAPAVQTASLTPENAPFLTDISNLFTERDLRTDYEITSSVSLDEITDSVLNITQEGVYELSGTFNGQVHVNTEGKVQIVLNNAEINNPSGSAIYVENAKKVFLTLAENSQNTVSDGASYTDASATAVIYSTDDLTINGKGSLTVNANYQEGITSKDDLSITGGTITVNAVGNGIKGKDSVSVYDGSLNITSGGDGLKASNDVDEGKGFICIQNGNITINAQKDGIQAESELIVTGGTFQITSGGGVANAPEKHDEFDFEKFKPNQNSDSESDSDSDTTSTKGMKAGSVLYISNGTFSIDTADSAVHSKGSVWVAGGTFNVNAGNNAVHAGEAFNLSGGTLNVGQSYEGIEADSISVSGGTILLNSSDDGFNASDGSQQGAMGGAVDASVEISGGYIYINADGDGIDSNGKLNITGGTVLVNGSVNDMNGALDSNNGITVSGGLLVAVGSAGMAEYPEESSQNTIVITLDDYQNPDTLVTICDETGTEVLSFAPAKKFDSVVFSSDALQTGKTYTLYLNGSSTAEQQNGLYANGSYQKNGTESGSVTLQDSVSFIGEARTMDMPSMPNGGGPKDFNPSKVPQDFDPSKVPQDFDPSKMPDKFPDRNS